MFNANRMVLPEIVSWLCLNVCDCLTMARSCQLIDERVAENEDHYFEIDVSCLVSYLMNNHVDQQVDHVVNYGYCGA